MSVFLEIDNAPVVLEISDADADEVGKTLLRLIRSNAIATAASSEGPGFVIQWSNLGVVLISTEYDPPFARARPVHRTTLAAFQGGDM